MNAAVENINSMFLSASEVADLTGYKLRSKQIQWLRREGFQFRVAADGRPRVLRQAIIAALGGTEAQPRQLRRVEPNWGGMT